jgi:hypothetical protein
MLLVVEVIGEAGLHMVEVKELGLALSVESLIIQLTLVSRNMVFLLIISKKTPSTIVPMSMEMKKNKILEMLKMIRMNLQLRNSLLLLSNTKLC